MSAKYAVVKTGGKQYRVAEGDTFRVEKLEAAAGSRIQLDQVLMIVDGTAIRIGQPVLAGATVETEVVDADLAEKVQIFKYRRRHRYRRKAGHRQPYTELKVTRIAA
jgi:large subunit ribosomal protein L21